MRRIARRPATRPLRSHHFIHALAAGIGRALREPAPAAPHARQRRAPAALLATTLVLSCSVVAPVRADDWTGTASNDWFTAANWLDGSVPTAADDAFVDTTLSNPTLISGGAAFADLLVVGQLGLGELTISGGGTLTSVESRIGNGASSQGAVAVSGTGSAWTNPGVIIVGNDGSGSLAISDGGAVSTSASVTIGDSVGGQGTMTVDGIGSVVTDEQNFTIGRAGAGMLSITAGGLVESGAATIAELAGATGTATVSGPGSQWDSGVVMLVGYGGIGTLDISAGGAVSALSATLGDLAGAQGTVSIDGSGSSLGVGNALTIGGAGTGTLTIDNGGAADAGAITLGRDAGGQGTLRVSGSLLTHTGTAGEFIVGLNGTGTLTVDAGGVVDSANNAVLGVAAGSQGSATVSGAGSQWRVEELLAVGRNGDGALSVVDGGRVEAIRLEVGENPGGTGTATVAGGGSVVQLQALGVGSGGSGSLTIEDGALLGTATGASIGAGQGSGTLTVTGPGSTWNTGGVSFVGFNGNGSVNVLGGGVVNAADASIGHTQNAQGAVTVSGAGSRWQGSGSLTVGNNATGTLDIADGGQVESSEGRIGDTENGQGTANVSGPGSSWTMAGDLTVGGAGTGSLAISGGGSVSNAGVGILGGQAGAQGTVTVSGAGSSWTNGSTLQIGSSGNGALGIEDGGTVSSGEGFIGVQAVAQGTVTVSGPGSHWTSGNLRVGELGSGELRIDAGGTTSSEFSFIGDQAGAQGAVTVSGLGSQWSSAGELTVGAAGAGTLAIDGGGTVSSGSAIIGRDAGGVGAVTVDGGGSSWDSGDALVVGDLGSGELTVSDGGAVSVTAGVEIAQDAGATGTLNIGAGEGEAAVAAGVVESPSITFGAGNGTLNFNHTDRDYVFDAAIGGSGTLNQLAGTTSLTGAGDAGGALNVRGGTLRVEGTLGDIATTVFDGAALGGSGAIGGDVTVADGGILAPGSSAGTLTLGSLALSAGSLLDYELGQAGVIGGGVNDLIEINGDLTLDGTFDVTDIGGFGAGVYRLMNYGGALTDNGLEFGTLPTAADPQDLFLQTAIDGQVNLVNSAGLTLSFWDGSVATEHNNDAIDDGDGMWNAGNDNWTASDGAVNGRWDDGTFAVFGGAGGTVDVVGEQAVAGMQFMSGYTLDAGANGALRIDDAESVIRVDPTVTATIAAPIVGAGGLVKTDTGTLVLSGANTYGGGTAIDMGTLVVSVDNNLGDTAGALSFAGGTLRNSAAFTTSRAVTLEAGGGTFETAADLTVAGAIDGDGALAKTGDGVLTLTGTNTYAGGTTVAVGTLSVSADANLGDAAGALTLAGGTLQTTAAFDSAREVVLAGGTLQNDADLGLSGTVSGGAALIKDGAGTLTLTGDNTYGGGTRVLEGTLVGDVDAIRGNLDNAGTVVFDQAIDATFVGTIGGSGNMVKRGAGALTLGAASALDWSIDVGALTARAAQFTGDATIADGATLRFTEAGGTYAGTLSGAGTFEIAGGTTVFALAGNSAGFGGRTLLESGTLRIDGALGGLTLIATGAMLTGTGTLGSVDNAGTVAAGNSIGTLTLTGDYVHRDDATLLAEIEPGGGSDLLDIAGAATIEGGEVQVIKLPGQYEGGTRYTLIDAAGGVTGTFATLGQDLPFLDLLLGYDANHVYLDVQRNDVGFDIVCGDGTFNQCQVAGALDRVGEGDAIKPDLETVLTEITTLDLDQARAGFDRLSGEAHGSLAGILLEGHALYGQTVSRRIADRREAVGVERLQGGAWVRAYGASSDLDGDGNAHAADFEQRGLAVGFDAWGGEHWLIGASFNAMSVDADFRPGDHGEADAKNASLYASVQGDHAYLDAVTSFAWWDNEITRRIAVGSIAREARSEYGGHRFATHLEAGWTFALGQTQQLTPLVSVEYAKLDQEGFREDGAQDLDLIGRSQDVERTTVSAGLRWTTAFERGDWTFEPTVQARWLHAFGDEHAEQTVAFAGAPDIGYRMRGVSWPQDRGLFGVGLQMRHGGNLDLFVDVDYQKGGGLEAKNIGAGLRWRW